MAEGEFGTTINCIDGRIQAPVAQWLKKRYGLDYVDVVTAAGADKVLAGEATRAVESIRSQVGISVSNHGSRVIAVVGHHDCAGNPVSDEAHREQIEQSVAVVRGWGYRVAVVGLWVDENWAVQVVRADD